MSPDSNRRDFLVSKLAAGFAAAVLPVGAATITTDTGGITAGEVEIPTGGIRIPAYRAMPASGASFPTVLVIQEIFGVHEHIKDLCRRLAKQGYLAVAPELYARQGDVSKIEDIRQVIQKVVSKVPDAQVMSDLDATAVWAGQNHGDLKRLATTGFCWGGRIAWLYAAHSSQLKAAAAWYGRLVGKASDLTPKNPIDIVADLKAPVIGFYGGKDQGIPADSIEQMRAAISAVHKKAEIHVYPDAGHGFNADYRPSYNEAAAKDAWARMLAFFHQNGVT